MLRGSVKLTLAAALAGVVAVILLLLTARARAEGRLSHCRNNLRQLGVLAHSQYAANYEGLPEAGGRAFWQVVREFKYYDARNKSWRAEALNPFGCPVRNGVTVPLDKLDPASLARHMADPATIDYRGPAEFPDEPSKMVLGADREGNHPSGGHVLFADFSIMKTGDALAVGRDWSVASRTRD